ncbi:MAG TPA: hypothetical protein VMH39_08550, partial [Gemmatimonadaceae bacterium]|nr:hypothetical protein [Gemmatimonadaceae bacterium]
LDVVDSTYDVAGFDVGVNPATDVGMVRDFRYQQRFDDAGGGRWMPYLIEYTASVHLELLGGDFALESTAVLDQFRFNQGAPPAGLGEYGVIVADGADRPDSATWAAAPTLPPQWTPVDGSGLSRDSVAYGGIAPARQRAGEAARRLVGAASAIDPVHFNRVDGWSFGLGWTWHDLPDAPWMVPTAGLAYATGSRRWQYRAGDQFRLSDDRRLWLGAAVQDETVARSTLLADGYNPSLRAIFAGAAADGLDYYREQDAVISLSSKLVGLLQLDAAYGDRRQSSLAVLPRYAADTSEQHRAPPNPAILDGRLRTLSVTLSYDSRPMLRQRGLDERLPMPTATQVSLAAETSMPWTGGGAFVYQRYILRARHTTTSELGRTTLAVAGGLGTSSLPPQRYFTVDGGATVLQSQDAPFSTLVDSVYAGNRAAAASLEHDFGRQLFTRSAIPLMRLVPLTLAVHAGVFWTRFEGMPTFARAVAPASAPGPYREAGFTIGNLTPFLSPIDLAVRFGWQISAYPTARSRIGLGIGTP